MKPTYYRTVKSFLSRRPSLGDLDSTTPPEWLSTRRHIHILDVETADLYLLCLSLIETSADVRLENENLSQLLTRCNMNKLASGSRKTTVNEQVTWKQIYAGLDNEFICEQLLQAEVDLWIETGKHPLGWVDFAGRQVAVNARSYVEALARALILGSALSGQPLVRFRLTDPRLRYLFPIEIF